MVEKCKGKFNEKELKIGTAIEQEHGFGRMIAEKIARDHLQEFPRYYTQGLIPMEKRLEKLCKLNK